MKNFRETCIDFFNNEEIRKEIKALLKPLTGLIYNELYVYVWIIAIYNIVLVCLLITILLLLIRIGWIFPGATIKKYSDNI